MRRCAHGKERLAHGVDPERPGRCGRVAGTRHGRPAPPRQPGSLTLADYLTLKAIHEGAVTLSGLGFFARGAGALAAAGWVRSRAARSLPHFVDTVLLLSAVALVWMLGVDPREVPWLMAKIIALVVYIGLGIVALRPGLSMPVRRSAWLAALATFAYIVSVAITKNPLGFFAAIP